LRRPRLAAIADETMAISTVKAADGVTPDRF
jgi:hypothetical protein